MIDRDVRVRLSRPDLGEPFQRFRTWMRRNGDVDAFVAWMRARNRGRAAYEQVVSYGLDLYNMAGSTRAVIDYLDRVDPARYGRRATTRGYAECEQAVTAMLFDLFSKSRDYGSASDPDFLDAAQNARLVADAEAYYRAMHLGSAESWNLRDEHVADTLDLMLAAKPDAKAVA